MKSITDQLKASVVEYCATIGADPLLVQGAGGNISWKSGDTLWVKASGTWLADAADTEIFVPVDLPHLRTEIESGNFAVIPRLQRDSVLRPSIETLLHALMPHRVVLHLHAIEALAHLVRNNCHADFQSLLDQSTPWAIVDYYRPGTELATAVSAALDQKPTIGVIFLKNHGIVIGGSNIAEVNKILRRLIAALRTAPADVNSPSSPRFMTVPDSSDQYTAAPDTDVHHLALNRNLFSRLVSDWALYPDQVVFLGARAHVYRTCKIFAEKDKTQSQLPELVFIHGHGVFVLPSFNKAKLAQLRCYYDVLTRQSPNSSLRSLTDAQIGGLLNWDAEQYRMNLAK